MAETAQISDARINPQQARPNTLIHVHNPENIHIYNLEIIHNPMFFDWNHMALLPQSTADTLPNQNRSILFYYFSAKSEPIIFYIWIFIHFLYIFSAKSEPIILFFG